MGTEFLAKQKRSAKKYLDRQRAELCAPGLFKLEPKTAGRQYVARAEAKADLHPGDQIQLEVEGAGIILRRAGRVVGRNDCPHPTLKRELAEGPGYFPAAVTQVHTLSSTFEFRVAPPAGRDRPHA